MILDFIFDFALVENFEKNYKLLVFEVFRKMVFRCSKYFESISIKISAFQKLFFIKMFRIEGSTNAKSFLKI